MIHSLFYYLSQTIWCYSLVVFILLAGLIALFKSKVAITLSDFKGNHFHGAAFIGLLLLDNKVEGAIVWYFICTLLVGVIKCKMVELLINTGSETPFSAAEKLKIRGAILLNPLYKWIAIISLLIIPLFYLKIGAVEFSKISSLPLIVTVTILAIVMIAIHLLRKKINYTASLLFIPLVASLYCLLSQEHSDFSLLTYLQSAFTAQALSGGIVATLFREMIIDATKRATLLSVTAHSNTLSQTQSELIFNLLLTLFAAPLFLLSSSNGFIISVIAILMIITVPISSLFMPKEKRWHRLLILLPLPLIYISQPILTNCTDFFSGLLGLCISACLLITLPRVLTSTNSSY